MVLFSGAGAGGQLLPRFEPRATSAQVMLNFDEGDAGSGSSISSAVNSGSAAIRVDVVTRSGGAAKRTAALASRWGVRLPAFSDSSDPARAVLRIRASSGDPLSPRSDPFDFGADFRLDPRSTGSSVDNGDNLVQRGLYNDRGQYKLELDGGRVGCRVKGASGAVYVRSTVQIQRDTWYRAVCRREGDQVTVHVARLTASGPGSFTRTTAQGATGDVNLGDTVPLSAGGKLRNDGAMEVSATDQFNGVVDRVLYRRQV